MAKKELWITVAIGFGQEVRKSILKLDPKATFPYDHKPDGSGSFWVRTKLKLEDIIKLDKVRDNSV